MSHRDEIEALITTHKRRLQKLKEQLAYAGQSADPKISMEIEDIETQIAELQSKLSARLFIAYKRNTSSDQKLATYLHETLTAHGHEVFIDQTLRTGDAWLEQIDQQIKASDFLIVLLSKESADSEMIQAEVNRAYEYRKLQGKPHTLPVRLAYEGLLPYSIAALLNPVQYVVWQNEADNKNVAREILAAVKGQLPQQKPIQIEPATEANIISEDGRPVADDERIQPPLPEFDPRFLAELEVPGGAVKLRDKLYIEREADKHLKREIVKWGATITIRAPRQTGKISLLMRGIREARQSGAKVISLDFQGFGHDQLVSCDVFLREFAETMCHELRLDPADLEKAWRGSLGAQNKLTYFMEDYILPAFEGPIILAMDEADCLLQTNFYRDFFGLVRSWHNRRAKYETWEKLNIVLVISTEPYLLIEDVNQSPFNVGLKLELADFNESQMQDLNQRHGLPVAEENFGQFMTLLHGHPYLTRKAFYTLLTERLTWADLIPKAATDNGPFGDHLRRHYWGLRDKPELRAALKQIIRDQCCPDEMSLFRLVKAGLIKGSGDAYTCRCDLYRQYFEEKLL
ncbi:MAG: AAA-like domain-containing protein [Anaerolineae bacterium]|nr:AAA-like domain-containing protein [Anaerolineae bacterium]